MIYMKFKKYIGIVRNVIYEFFYSFKINRRIFIKCLNIKILKVISKIFPTLKSIYIKYRNASEIFYYLSNFEGIKIYHRYYDFFPIVDIFYKKEYTKLESFIPQKGDIVLDLGSGIGDFALLASIYVGNEGKVIAIEPNKESYSILLQNINLNQRYNILPLRYAISDKNKKVKIFKGGSAHRDSIFRNGKKFYKVESKTIDSLVKELRLKKVNLIKMDIEGAEYRAIKKAKYTLTKFKPKIVIEIHEDVKETEYVKKREMLNFLKNLGYKLLFEKINSKCPYIAVLYFSISCD